MTFFIDSDYTFDCMNRTIDQIGLTGRGDTKTRIMDAAEMLFAERGYEAASLRAITAAAGANLASINYHFGSKEALLRAVMARRLVPLNLRRLEMLGRFEVEYDPAPVPVENILRALLEPISSAAQSQEGSWQRFRLLVGRMYSEPTSRILAVFWGELSEIAGRFQAAIRRACPHLPENELYWRVHFTVGAMAHTLSAGTLLEMLSRGKCDPSDIAEGVERLIAFAAAGFRAPATEAPGSASGRPAESGRTGPQGADL